MKPLKKYDTESVLQTKKDKDNINKCPICGTLHKGEYLVCHICRKYIPLLANNVHIGINSVSIEKISKHFFIKNIYSIESEYKRLLFMPKKEVIGVITNTQKKSKTKKARKATKKASW